MTLQGHCDSHYVVLRSESLADDNVIGQHPGVSMFTAGHGNVGGTYANTGQVRHRNLNEKDHALNWGRETSGPLIKAKYRRL